MLAVLLLPAHTSFAEPPSKKNLSNKLDGFLKEEALSNAKVGIHVRDLSSGATLYEHNGARPLNPASNIKLVTAAAVLDKYGPSHTYTTSLHGAGLRGSSLEGDIFLKGGGDPFLLWSHLLELAERTRRKGVTVIKGDLVVDDTAFDDKFLPPAFEQKSEDAAYRASISAAAAEFGALTVIVTPKKAGEKPRISFDPPNDYARVQNTAITVDDPKEAAKDALKISAVADGDRTTIVIAGKTHAGAQVRKRMDNPSLYTGYLLRRALKLLGIKLQGKVRRGKLKGKTTLLAKHSSYALAYNIAAMQKWSNNYMAEMLFKSLAMSESAATWEGAQKAMRAFMEKAGVTGTYRLTNGSGLYDANAISPEQFTQVLLYMESRSDLRPEFETSFAIAAVDGTLKRRMKEGSAKKLLRGKTGTLKGVVTITGYVETKNGRRLAYSILFNKTKGGAWTYRKLQDKMLRQLVAWGSK